MGAEEQVHHREALFDLFGHPLLLGHAAAHRHDEIGIAALLMHQGPHIAIDPHFGMFPHGAGVEQHQVGLFRLMGEGKAHLGHHAPEYFAVRFILLAAVGVGAGHGRPPQLFLIILMDALAVLLLAQKFLLGYCHRCFSHVVLPLFFRQC